MKRRGSAGVVILIAAGVILLGAIFVPIILIGAWVAGELDKPTGYAGPSGATCYMEDSGFSDLSIAADVDKVIEKLRNDDYKAGQIDKLQQKTTDAKEFKYYIQQIIDKGVEKKINPSVVIGIWWGEEEFLHPEKAFGFKHYGSGAAKEVITGTTEERWQKQLAGVYEVIQDAIDQKNPYQNPAGEKLITRLFYNYAEAMQEQYKNSSGSWSQSYSHPQYGNPFYKRLGIIKLLSPDYITCISLSGIGIASGNFTCPVDFAVAERSAKSGWGNVLPDASKRRVGNYRTGTYDGHEGFDLMTHVGANIYSASNGKVVAVSEDNDGDGQSSTSVTIEENSQTFWYYTHLQNTAVSVGQTINKGDKIAEVGTYIRNNGEKVHHLHLGISKRLNDRNTNGKEYNWDAWYYPYEFLRYIDCLQPPKPEEVSYP